MFWFWISRIATGKILGNLLWNKLHILDISPGMISHIVKLQRGSGEIYRSIIQLLIPFQTLRKFQNINKFLFHVRRRMTREVKLHLYVRQDFEFLNSMIEEEILSIVSQPPELEITGNIASNWWLIQMPDNSDKTKIKELLNNIPFRYDTMSYAFTVNTGS